MKPLFQALRSMGAWISSLNNNDYAPFIIKGPIKGNKVEVEGKDSQFVSSLLMAFSMLDKKMEIYVKNPGEKPWVDLTLSWLKRLGIYFENHNYIHYVVKGCKYKGFDYVVPADFSSCLYPLVGALITNSTLTIKNMDLDDSQGDKKVIYKLIEMGANIKLEKDKIIIRKTKILKGAKIDVNDFIDSIPILAVLGCFLEDKLILHNGLVAKHKESNRLETTLSELKKMRADITLQNDTLIIKPSSLKGALVNSHKDHRIALALSIAGLKASGKTILEDVDCIDKSYPFFKEDFLKIGARIL